MKPLLLVIAAEISGRVTSWIQTNAPAFLRPGHDIIASQSPTDDQIRAAGTILIPESQSYFGIAGRAVGKNIVFLDTGIDGRDFVPSGNQIKHTIGVFDHLLGVALSIARNERTAAEALRHRLSCRDAEVDTLRAVAEEQRQQIAVLNVGVAMATTPPRLEKLLVCENGTPKEITVSVHDETPPVAADEPAVVTPEEAAAGTPDPEPAAIATESPASVVDDLVIATTETVGVVEPVASEDPPAPTRKIRDIRRKPAEA